MALRSGDELDRACEKQGTVEMPTKKSITIGKTKMTPMNHGQALRSAVRVFTKGTKMRGMKLLVSALVCCSVLCGSCATLATAQDDPLVGEIAAVSTKLAEAFNGGNADGVVAMFVENGELISEDGVVYEGREGIKSLLSAFFESYPGVQVGEEVESIRQIGPVVVKEGVRIMATKDGANLSRMRFITTYVKGESGWQIASIRDFGDEVPLTPHELLGPLDWLIGDWVNEGADARVKISYRWSDDKNFILGDYLVKSNDGTETHSTQRIGWDPLIGKPRSWLFDADGGFAEATWTALEDGWLVNSSAVIPDGMTGSAVLKLTPRENGRYVISGTNRVVGDQLEDDYEITVVKQPQTSSGK